MPYPPFRLSHVAPFGQLGSLSVQPGRGQWVVRYRSTIYSAILTLKTAANADVIVDINLNGTTVFTNPANRPRITSGQIGPVEFDLEALGLDFIAERLDVVRVDLDQAGTGGSPGEDLTVDIEYSMLPEL